MRSGDEEALPFSSMSSPGFIVTEMFEATRKFNQPPSINDMFSSMQNKITKLHLHPYGPHELTAVLHDPLYVNKILWSNTWDEFMHCEDESIIDWSSGWGNQLGCQLPLISSFISPFQWPVITFRFFFLQTFPYFYDQAMSLHTTLPASGTHLFTTFK